MAEPIAKTAGATAAAAAEQTKPLNTENGFTLTISPKVEIHPVEPRIALDDVPKAA